MTVHRQDLKLYTAMAAKMTGALSGAAVTLATHNPFIAASVNVMTAVPLEALGNQVIENVLAERPKLRVARAVAVAGAYIRAHLDEGRALRDDGFFVRPNGAASAADEAVEAALQVAFRAAQERKVDFIGYLLAHIVIDPAIDADTAHLLLELADRLTFRAMVLLAIAGRNDGTPTSPRPMQGTLPPPALHPIMVDAYGLCQIGLVEFKNGPDDDDTYLVSVPSQVDGGRMYPTPTGRLLFEALGLTFMDDGDPTYAATVSQLTDLATFAMNRAIADGGFT